MDKTAGKRVLEIARLNNVTRGGLQAELTAAESTGELNREMALAAMRALLSILRDAEGAP